MNKTRIILAASALSLLGACAQGPLRQQEAILADGKPAITNQFKAEGTFGSDENCTARVVDSTKRQVEFYPGCHASTGEVAGLTNDIIQGVSAAGNVASGVGMIKQGWAYDKMSHASGGSSAATQIIVEQTATAINH